LLIVLPHELAQPHGDLRRLGVVAGDVGDEESGHLGAGAHRHEVEVTSGDVVRRL